MRRRLRDGLLLGAAAGALWTVLEALRLMPGHLYQLDPAAWVLPGLGTALLGGLCGLAGALLLPLCVPRGLRERQPALALAAPVLALCTAACLMVLARNEWMPGDARLFSVDGLRALGWAVFGGAAVHLLLLLLTALRPAWALASLCAPPVTAGLLGAITLGAVICLALPVRPALLAAEAHEQARADAPNVLLIVLDTVRADHLGCYGHVRPTSPRLDELAAEGVLFEQAFAAAPWTLPSHASLFTGLHPQTHGTGWEHPRLHDGRAGVDGVAVYDFPVLAEELGMRGYATFGASNKSWIRHQTGLTQGFAEYQDMSQPALGERFLLSALWRRYTAEPEDLAVREDKGGRELVARTLDWMDRRPEGQPYFAFLNLNEAHDPYYPPRDFWPLFLPEGVALEDTKPRALDQSTEYRRANWEGRERYSAAEVEVLKALYDAEILYQDGLLGALFDGLAERGLLDDTLVIVTSDHGEEFLETGNRIGHQMSLSDRLVRVPLLMRWPAGLPAGRRVTAMASLVDVFPTVLDVVLQPEGEAVGPPVEGLSLLPAVSGSGAVRDFAIAHYDNPSSFLASAFDWDPTRPEDFALAPLMRRITMLRGSERKYLSYGDGREAMVDLAADPLEEAAEVAIPSPELRALAAQYRLRLMQQLNDHRRRHETVFGHIHAFRAGTVDAAGPDGLAAHELGYAGDSEAPTRASDALKPFLGFPESTD